MPIHSMTGFGVADRAWTERGLRVHVELRSVNARFLEIKLRTPFGVAAEHRLRRLVEARLGRGRVDLSIRVEGGGEAGLQPLAAIGVAREDIAEVLAALASLIDEAYQASFQVSHPTSLELLKFLISRKAGDRTEHSAAPAFLDELVGEALTHLVEMRTTEGEALATVIAESCDALERQVARIESSLEGEGERLGEQLGSRCAALLGDASLDRDRVAQEIALLVARGDVGEELARITSHLGQARAILAAKPAAGQGKTLDFICQELVREVTTIGSKITSHAGSAVVIEAKRTIEQIREQVQNVE